MWNITNLPVDLATINFIVKYAHQNNQYASQWVGIIDFAGYLLEKKTPYIFQGTDKVLVNKWSDCKAYSSLDRTKAMYKAHKQIRFWKYRLFLIRKLTFLYANNLVYSMLHTTFVKLPPIDCLMSHSYNATLQKFAFRSPVLMYALFSCFNNRCLTENEYRSNQYQF